MLKVEKAFLFLVLLSGIWGSALNSFSVGPFHIFAFRIFWVFLVLMFLVRLLFLGKFYTPSKPSKTIGLFFLFWLIYASGSFLWVLSIGDFLKPFILLIVGISLVLLVSFYTQSVKECYRIFQVWIFMASILIAVGIWEVLAEAHLPSSKLYGLDSGLNVTVPTAVFHNPNDFATFLALSFPFAISLYKHGASFFSRVTGIVLSFLVIIMIGFTGSRANMIAVLVGGIFFLFAFSNLGSKIKFSFGAPVLIATSIFAAPEIFLDFFDLYKEQILSVIVQAQSDEGSIAVRLNLALNSLHFLAETYGFGVGLGNAEYWMEHYGAYNTHGILNPHNWWVEILVEFGIFVFVFYLISFFYIILKTYRLWKTSTTRKERMISEAILAALVVFVVASISSSSIMAFRPMWILFGLALAHISVRHREFPSRKKFIRFSGQEEVEV